MKLGDYRLCFKRGLILYFTDNFDKQWGDDWNDSYWDCNAEPPYEIVNTERDGDIDDQHNESRGRIVRVAFEDAFSNTSEPGETYCVKAINAGSAAWLTIATWVPERKDYTYSCLLGGDTLRDCVDKLSKAGIRHAILANAVNPGELEIDDSGICFNAYFAPIDG